MVVLHNATGDEPLDVSFYCKVYRTQVCDSYVCRVSLPVYSLYLKYATLWNRGLTVAQTLSDF